jgi:hypothetical protein
MPVTGRVKSDPAGGMGIADRTHLRLRQTPLTAIILPLLDTP